MTTVEEIPTDTIFGSELILIFKLLNKKYNDDFQSINYKESDNYVSETDYLIPETFSRVYGLSPWHGAEFFCFCEGPDNAKFYFYLDDSHKYFEFYSFNEFYESIDSIGKVKTLKLY